MHFSIYVASLFFISYAGPFVFSGVIDLYVSVNVGVCCMLQIYFAKFLGALVMHKFEVGLLGRGHDYVEI